MLEEVSERPVFGLRMGCALLAMLVSTQAHCGGVKSIQVFVALCDNVNQGIVPVPAALGDGEDVKNNLYWGARYGVKTHSSSPTLTVGAPSCPR